MDFRYGLRALGTMLAHPSEGVFRVRQRRVLGQAPDDLGLDYGAVADWEERLHALFGLAWPCAETGAFDDVLSELAGSLPEFPHGHDADPSFAKAIWCVTCHARPEKVVETGVARGVSSRFVLQGLARNGSGHLWSIDLPPVIAGFHGTVGAAVSDEVRDRWTYVRGPSARELPRLLNAVAPIELFIQDSVGERATVVQELELAWHSLRPGGWLIVNAINRSEAFQDFSERHVPRACLVADAGAKSRYGGRGGQVTGQFAVVLKAA